MSTVVVDDQVLEMPFKNVTQLHVRRRRPSHEYIETHIALESVIEDASPKESHVHQPISPFGATKSLRLHLDDVPFADPNFTRLASLELSPSTRTAEQPVGNSFTPAQRLREKLSSFIEAAHAAGQPCAAPWIDLDHQQPPPLQSNLLTPRTQPGSPRSRCAPPPSLDAGSCGSFRSRTPVDGKGVAKRSMSESNLMQDIAWQRMINVGCEPSAPAAALGSFLERRNSRRTSVKSSASAASLGAPTLATTAARPAVATTDMAVPLPPPMGPPPACCSAADTAAAQSPDGQFAAGSRGAAGRMRGTDKAVFRAQVAAALGKGRAVWL